jgi:hypothetical protein
MLIKRRFNGEAIWYYREEGSKKVVESRVEIMSYRRGVWYSPWLHRKIVV